MIAFVGSVFSPYYAAARRRGTSDPLDHVGINAILYTPAGKYWSMTERGRAAIDRSPGHIAIGPSSWALVDDRLVIDIDEWTVPIPKRLCGRVTVDLGPVFRERFGLHWNGRHHWQPVAPCARVSVEFERPGLSWQGKAYLDINTGTEPLEAGFRHWNWSRDERAHATRIHYDVVTRDGARQDLAMEYRADGSSGSIAPGRLQRLPKTGWRVERRARLSGDRIERQRTLEDTPFYSRSMLTCDGVDGTIRSVHETVDLDRFASRWCQILLPFKMPRRAGWVRRGSPLPPR